MIWAPRDWLQKCVRRCTIMSHDFPFLDSSFFRMLSTPHVFAFFVLIFFDFIFWLLWFIHFFFVFRLAAVVPASQQWAPSIDSTKFLNFFLSWLRCLYLGSLRPLRSLRSRGWPGVTGRYLGASISLLSNTISDGIFPVWTSPGFVRGNTVGWSLPRSKLEAGLAQWGAGHLCVIFGRAKVAGLGHLKVCVLLFCCLSFTVIWCMLTHFPGPESSEIVMLIVFLW
jgi:hypothetical protein